MALVNLSNPRLVRVPMGFASELDAVVEFGNKKLSDGLKRKIKLFYGYLIERQGSLKEFDWIHLKSTFLREKIHQRDYRIGIMYLVGKDLIREDESYLVGEFSKSFRVNEDNFDPSAEFVTLEEYSESDISLCPSLDSVSFSPEDIKKLRMHGKKIEDGKKKGWRRFCWDLSLNRVIQKDWMISMDRKTGRMFTNVTSMPKEMRKMILLGGESVVEIDISNSQPYFALTVYLEESEEKSRYADLVTSGRFYESLQDGLTPSQTSRIKGRDRLKERVYQEVFFGMDSPKYSLWKVFKGLFPELGAVFTKLKQPERKEMRKSNRLSLLLQKAEADVVVGGLLAECIRENIPLLTVHDSVICRKSDQKKVIGKFQSHLLKAVGVLPTLKISS